MAPKSRRRNNNQSTSAAYAGDIDSDAPIASYPQHHNEPSASGFELPAHILQPRQNAPADLNLSVIARHCPDVTSILAIAPYSVIYTFSPTAQTWEKSGVEGTLFICSLTPPHSHQHETRVQHRYAAIVLNRRGLDNFQVELLTTEDVEVTDEYIILTDHHSDTQQDPTIYGVWIFSEPPPNSTAGKREEIGQVIVACAEAAESSRDDAEAAIQSNGGRASDQPQPQPQPQSQQASGRSLMDLLSPGASSAPPPLNDPFMHQHLQQPLQPPQQQHSQSWNAQHQPHFHQQAFYQQPQHQHPPPKHQHQHSQPPPAWGFPGNDNFAAHPQSGAGPGQANSLDGLFQRARMGQPQQRPLM